MPILPEFSLKSLTPSQTTVYQGIVAGPRGKFGGPFYALIQSPTVAEPAQALGAALRFHTSLEEKLREVAILTAAREWKCEVEWNAHVVIAIALGISEECINGILHQEIPTGVPKEQRQVYVFCLELLQEKFVFPETYSETAALLGIEQMIELVSMVGYFTLLAMLLNSFKIEHDEKDGLSPEHLKPEEVIPNTTT